MLKSVLIANRGEIACRIIATARSMGVRTIAVYSEAEAQARHIRLADSAVLIGPAAARESYLVGAAIIAAALESGAEAVHPGYGFLAENADFAEAVIAAGLVWIGPPPAAIRSMGLKDAAKALMSAAGVPVTPGYHGQDQDPARLAHEADAIGYPVLIKAVAGGGGKGMRRVAGPRDFAEALESCRREALSAFGDDRVLIEKWIANPRHLEVQVFGDSHGNIVHLFERDCSLQRRHQKVIEEAPAPGIDPLTRAVICDAALRAARAVQYEGAGTIEFIADATGGLNPERVWFMEMNTRLQVEHPVTEAITGVDLVEWQLRVAAGEPLPLRQNDIVLVGHAIEARIYAEDPARGFLPATGTLEQLWFAGGVRVDSAVEQGDAITPYYDPMIAKLIAHGETREAARRRLLSALETSRIAPLKTNQGFLYECLDDPAFIAGQHDTGLIEARGSTLVPSAAPSQSAADAAARRLRADWLGWQLSPRERALARGLFGLRLGARAETRIRLWSDGHEVLGDSDGGGSADGEASELTEAGTVLVSARGMVRAFGLEPPRPGLASGAAGNGAVLAPMPGKVIALDVGAGDSVVAGQRLLVLEAMKMEHALLAPFAGTVAELTVVLGAQVEVESVLVRIAAVEAEPAD